MAENPSSTSSSVHPRPLSPHLTIYKPQITTILSITHRITGVGLVVGVIAFVAWLWMLAYCPDGIATVKPYFDKQWIQGFMALWTFAFYYHFMNGIRHLFWDMGLGLELDAAQRSGIIAVLGAAFLTGITWYYLLN